MFKQDGLYPCFLGAASTAAQSDLLVEDRTYNILVTLLTLHLLNEGFLPRLLYGRIGNK